MKIEAKEQEGQIEGKEQGKGQIEAKEQGKDRTV